MAAAFCMKDSYAQRKTQHSSKGDLLINAGIGLSNWGIPVYGGIEGFVHPDITVGGVLSYRQYRDNWSSYRYRFSITTISAVGNYHFNRVLNIPSDWDFYAGLNLGVNIYNENRPAGAPKYNRSVSGVGLGLQVGGRYYFSDNVGLNLEVGGGSVLSDARFGVTFKL